jgi:ribosomal protein S18 acetylase RimI-like enzyme
MTAITARHFRTVPRKSDIQAIRSIVESTGFFHDFEVDTAVELVQERLTRGLTSEYHFVFVDDTATGETIGYACFGPIACTVGSFDLYWIAVHAKHQGQGLGRRLMDEAVRSMKAGIPDASGRVHHARRIYIETSSQAQYEPTRRFYDRCGCTLEARMQSFYAPGDDKLVYVLTADAITSGS